MDVSQVVTTNALVASGAVLVTANTLIISGAVLVAGVALVALILGGIYLINPRWCRVKALTKWLSLEIEVIEPTARPPKEDHSVGRSLMPSRVGVQLAALLDTQGRSS